MDIVFKDIKKSLNLIRSIYSGYLIINILQNNQFEMFDTDIYTLAKYLNLNITKGKKTHIFEDCNNIISKLQQTKAFNVVLFKDKKLYLTINHLSKEQKIKNSLKRKHTKTTIKENFNKNGTYIVKKGTTNKTHIINNNNSDNNKTLERPENMPKLTRGIVARCYKCKKNISEFFEFDSGKCLCEECVNNLSNEDLTKELELKYSKTYENKSKIFRKVYLGGFS